MRSSCDVDIGVIGYKGAGISGGSGGEAVAGSESYKLHKSRYTTRARWSLAPEFAALAASGFGQAGVIVSFGSQKETRQRHETNFNFPILLPASHRRNLLFPHSFLHTAAA